MRCYGYFLDISQFGRKKRLHLGLLILSKDGNMVTGLVCHPAAAHIQFHMPDFEVRFSRGLQISDRQAGPSPHCTGRSGPLVHTAPDYI